MVHETATEVYQFHVWILQISPRFIPVSYSPSDASVDVTDARNVLRFIRPKRELM
jgi:hypothetical protein